jgi:hypothetical protein
MAEQAPITKSTERVLERPAEGWRPIVRIGLGFGLAMIGALVALLLIQAIS